MKKRLLTACLPALLAIALGCGDDDGQAQPDSSVASDSSVALDSHVGDDAADSTPDGGDAGLVEGAYFVSPQGNDSNPGTLDQPWQTLGKAAETLVAGDTVYIRQGTYAERLIPVNSGTQNSPITYAAYPGEEATIDGANVIVPGQRSGLVEISHVSDVRIEGLRVIHAGQGDNPFVGIHVFYASHITIRGCYTYDTVSSGIGSWHSSQIVIDGNEVEMACTSEPEECITVALTEQFQVSNNHVHHAGPAPQGGSGIDLKHGSSNGVVFGNLVHDLDKSGIYVDAWASHTFNIEIFGNEVYRTGVGFSVSSESGGLLENIRYYNNLSYWNQECGLWITNWGNAPNHPMRNIKVINNTFFGNGTEGWGPGIQVWNAEADDIVIRNNLMASNAYLQMEVKEAGQNLTVDHNLFHGDGGPVGTDAVSGDPLLMNPAGGDFRLQANSPAIDEGSAVDAPLVDFDGQARPLGLGHDIGAFEYLP